jgi:prephenate dehydrogenase
MPDVVIAGLGLIGGSIGKRLVERGWRVGFDDPHVRLEDALAARAAHEAATEADLLVIAAPVDIAMAMPKRARVVTTVCSVMLPFVDVVAGHPFAGSEKRGLAAADANLFEGRPWFVSRDDADVRRLVEACGATQVVIDPAKHDEMMALTSHLPQVIATALGSLLAEIDPMFIGTGAQSMLRLAASSYDVWRPVLEANEGNVQRAVDALCARMRELNREDFEKAPTSFRA